MTVGVKKTFSNIIDFLYYSAYLYNISASVYIVSIIDRNSAE